MLVLVLVTGNLLLVRWLVVKLACLLLPVGLIHVSASYKLGCYKSCFTGQSLLLVQIPRQGEGRTFVGKL